MPAAEVRAPLFQPDQGVDLTATSAWRVFAGRAARGQGDSLLAVGKAKWQSRNGTEGGEKWGRGRSRRLRHSRTVAPRRRDPMYGRWRKALPLYPPPNGAANKIRRWDESVGASRMRKREPARETRYNVDFTLTGPYTANG